MPDESEAGPPQKLTGALWRRLPVARRWALVKSAMDMQPLFGDLGLGRCTLGVCTPSPTCS
jgi:hypothetical protein